MSSSSTEATAINSLEMGYEMLLELALSENNGSSIVDIFGDYTWLLNNLSSTSRLPKAYVWEYRQSASTFAATMTYLKTGITSGTVLSNWFADGESSTNMEETIRKLADSDFNKNILGKNQFLLPYRNMYGLDGKNCFKYVFPYFSDDSLSFSQSFAETAQVETNFQKYLTDYFGNNGMFGGGIASKINDLGGLWNAAFTDKDASAEYNNTGVFMERPKYYQYDSTGDSITIIFPLFNTIPSKNGDTDPWIQNYKFIKNFMLKNLPYRTGLFNYRTPCLYSLVVPGQRFFPIAFVSAFKATCHGTRRIMSLSTKTIESNNSFQNKSVGVIVPEAWEISITFTSLLAKTANLYYQAFSGNYPTITTTDLSINKFTNDVFRNIL